MYIVTYYETQIDPKRRIDWLSIHIFVDGVWQQQCAAAIIIQQDYYTSLQIA